MDQELITEPYTHVTETPRPSRRMSGIRIEHIEGGTLWPNPRTVIAVGDSTAPKNPDDTSCGSGAPNTGILGAR